MTRLHVPIQLRWGDLDAYGHVNNAEMLRLLEEARIQTFWRPDAGTSSDSPLAILDARPGAESVALIARQEVEYLAPIPFMRTPIDIERAVAEMRASAWPHAQSFVDENLLAVPDRDEAIATLESRRT